MKYKASETRYNDMPYRRCGKSGLKLPAISLGLWHNFGTKDDFVTGLKTVWKAFDLGITHFDLANNYGPPAGSAESRFGTILKKDLSAYRDEMIISTKAGYGMWPGPYGDFGSRKYLLSSLDASLKRLDLEYVDIFYHHRPDPDTPIEETVGALAQAVHSGKALYAGISNYNLENTKKAVAMFKNLGLPLLINQVSYSMFNRWIEDDGLLPQLKEDGAGCIVFSPLSQGLLTEKYLKGVPADSRAARGGFLKPADITPEKLDKVKKLSELAKSRDQSLSQLALAWVLRHDAMTSALVGARTPEQVIQNAGTIKNLEISPEELKKIEEILAQ